MPYNRVIVIWHTGSCFVSRVICYDILLRFPLRWTCWWNCKLTSSNLTCKRFCFETTCLWMRLNEVFPTFIRDRRKTSVGINTEAAELIYNISIHIVKALQLIQLILELLLVSVRPVSFVVPIFHLWPICGFESAVREVASGVRFQTCFHQDPPKLLCPLVRFLRFFLQPFWHSSWNYEWYYRK